MEEMEIPSDDRSREEKQANGYLAMEGRSLETRRIACEYAEFSQLSRPEGSRLYLLRTFGFPVSSFPLTASSPKFVNVPNYW